MLIQLYKALGRPQRMQAPSAACFRLYFLCVTISFLISLSLLFSPSCLASRRPNRATELSSVEDLALGNLCLSSMLNPPICDLVDNAVSALAVASIFSLCTPSLSLPICSSNSQARRRRAPHHGLLLRIVHWNQFQCHTDTVILESLPCQAYLLWLHRGSGCRC